MATVASNSIDAQYPELWSESMQALLQKQLIGEVITSKKYSDVSYGDKVHVPYYGELTSGDYTPGTEVDPQNLSASDDSVIIDTSREVSFYVDDIEKLKSKYNFRQRVKDGVHQLRDDIDQSILGEYSNANVTIDASDISGGASSGNITLSTSNVTELFTTIKQKAGEGNMEMENLFLVLDYASAEIIERAFTDKGFSVADSTLRNGLVDNIMGIDIYRTNNLDANHLLAGVKGAISFVKRQAPKVQIRPESRMPGYTYLIYDFYGIDTLTKNQDRLIDINIA